MAGQKAVGPHAYAVAPRGQMDAAVPHCDAALDKNKMPGPRARTAHLAVANAEAASQWGTAASIWPLGATAYAWGTTVFWPANANAQNVAKSLRVDEGLADCIRSGNEVLYACDASIAVPQSLEASLRAGLGLL